MTTLQREQERARDQINAHAALEVALSILSIHSGQERPQDYLWAAARAATEAAKLLETLATYFDKENVR